MDPFPLLRGSDSPRRDLAALLAPRPANSVACAESPIVPFGPSPASPRNLLLAALPGEEARFIEERAERRHAKMGETIAGQDEPIEAVCFPEAGLASLQDRRGGAAGLEVALIGREGMVNAQVLLGGLRAQYGAHVQAVDMVCLCLPVADLRALCGRSPAARALFLGYVHSLSVMVATILTSNLRDGMERRLSRWLLTYHDRAEGDDIHLPHRDVARLIGVRRATVTETIHLIEGKGAIRNTRGRITVCDRAGLEALAGESYGRPEEQYRQLVAPFGKAFRAAADRPSGGCLAGS